jgi:general secretion pathway protein D
VSQDFEYIDIPIRLIVTPSAIWADSVSLDVEAEVSTALGGSVDVPPKVNKRLVKTEVTIADGQTLVIGGLINRSKEEFRRSVPILGRIPVLGRVLFTSKTRPQDVTTEIVVVLTPRVIDTTAEGDEVSAKAKELIATLKSEEFPLE